jgi:hypothetical protein
MEAGFHLNDGLQSQKKIDTCRLKYMCRLIPSKIQSVLIGMIILIIAVLGEMSEK